MRPACHPRRPCTGVPRLLCALPAITPGGIPGALTLHGALRCAAPPAPSAQPAAYWRPSTWRACPAGARRRSHETCCCCGAAAPTQRRPACASPEAASSSPTATCSGAPPCPALPCRAVPCPAVLRCAVLQLGVVAPPSHTPPSPPAHLRARAGWSSRRGCSPGWRPATPGRSCSRWSRAWQPAGSCSAWQTLPCRPACCRRGPCPRPRPPPPLPRPSACWAPSICWMAPQAACGQGGWGQGRGQATLLGCKNISACLARSPGRAQRKPAPPKPQPDLPRPSATGASAE